MGDLFNAQAYVDAISFALQAYVVMIVVSAIGGGYLWDYVKGRRGTFIMVTAALMNVFFLTFFGSYFLMTSQWGWDENLEHTTLFGLSLLLSLVCILLPIIPLRIWLNETKSPLQVEYENLKDEEMSPMDVRRKERMAKRAARGDIKPQR